RERGDNPTPVYAIVSQGGQQPEGSVIGWSVNKKQIEKELEKYTLGGGKWAIQKMVPDDQEPANPQVSAQQAPAAAKASAPSLTGALGKGSVSSHDPNKTWRSWRDW